MAGHAMRCHHRWTFAAVVLWRWRVGAWGGGSVWILNVLSDGGEEGCTGQYVWCVVGEGEVEGAERCAMGLVATVGCGCAPVEMGGLGERAVGGREAWLVVAWGALSGVEDGKVGPVGGLSRGQGAEMLGVITGVAVVYSSSVGRGRSWRRLMREAGQAISRRG